jgi:hypothetical protein
MTAAVKAAVVRRIPLMAVPAGRFRVAPSYPTGAAIVISRITAQSTTTHPKIQQYHKSGE